MGLITDTQIVVTVDYRDLPNGGFAMLCCAVQWRNGSIERNKFGGSRRHTWNSKKESHIMTIVSRKAVDLVIGRLVNERVV